MKKNENATVVASVENVVEQTTSTNPMSELEALKKKLADAAREAAEKKAELAQKMKELKEEAKLLKEGAKLEKEELKKAEAASRAQKIADAIANIEVAKQKVNMTEEIRTRLMAGMTLEQIAEETGFAKKSILDRVWLIEKRLGIR